MPGISLLQNLHWRFQVNKGPARFRGVPFNILGSTKEKAWSGQLIEYPSYNKDKDKTETWTNDGVLEFFPGFEQFHNLGRTAGVGTKESNLKNYQKLAGFDFEGQKNDFKQVTLASAAFNLKGFVEGDAYIQRKN